MGIFLKMFGENHFDFLKVSEVLSRGNRSIIDSRQAIFSLNVVIFSNNYIRSENSYGNTANAATLCLLYLFVLS